MKQVTEHFEFYDKEQKQVKTHFWLNNKNRLEGKVEHFRPNGLLEEKSTWSNGHRHGISALYDKNGFCYDKQVYKYGKLVSRKIYQPNNSK